MSMWLVDVCCAVGGDVSHVGSGHRDLILGPTRRSQRWEKGGSQVDSEWSTGTLSRYELASRLSVQ